jgi:hypothetical protein
MFDERATIHKSSTANAVEIIKRAVWPVGCPRSDGRSARARRMTRRATNGFTVCNHCERALDRT